MPMVLRSFAKTLKSTRQTDRLSQGSLKAQGTTQVKTLKVLKSEALVVQI